MLDTPVLLIIFNRPALTRKVFEAIRKARPHHLYVAADGPRPGEAEDEKRCRQSRAIIDSVDWDCEVRTKYSAVNLGCGPGPASAITWFFENVDQGIILEDDCLPNDTFFVFCREMLNRYKDVPRIMHVSGPNFQYGRTYGEGSYFFSRAPLCWGWATWRRAWNHYRFDLIPEVYRSHQSDTQWHMTVQINDGLAITPNVNLVSNIGYVPDATHTKGTSILANVPTYPLQLPLKHPNRIQADRSADRFLHYTRFSGLDTWQEIYKKMAYDAACTVLSPITRRLPERVKRVLKALIEPASQ